MNQQEERNCVAVSCSSCFLKLSMLQKQTEKIENMLFSVEKHFVSHREIYCFKALNILFQAAKTKCFNALN